ncbi:phosphate acyltransferase PlsX [candidate division TA06 bacterium]|nr:phosphate acyltransferase PlsX [candidate division TA06 bacterium]
MRIAVDVMGGDQGPEVIVEGVLEALKSGSGNFEICLVGNEKKIVESLELCQGDEKDPRILIRHAPEVVDIHESPLVAIRQKKESSIGVGTRMQKKGEVDAFLSAGNTGAVVAFAQHILERLKGVGRPAIGALLPAKNGGTLLLDVGANAECKPHNLLQFAIMGSIFYSHIYNKDNPTVGLLSIGEEATKGNSLTIRSHELIQNESSSGILNFIGNIEGQDILEGEADVVVCDGFVGNTILKFAESISGFVARSLKELTQDSLQSKLGGIFWKSSLREFLRRMNYEEVGGAPLLGLDGVTTICHGRSTAKAIKNAILATKKFVDTRVNEHIQKQMIHFLKAGFKDQMIHLKAPWDRLKNLSETEGRRRWLKGIQSRGKPGSKG